MPTQYDDDLVSRYFWKIQVLAVRALEGENVKAEAKIIVAKALEEFDTLSTTNSFNNRSALKHKLKYMASITHSSQPAQKEALEYAASLIPEDPASRNNK
jgi:hypothetical protein